MNRLLTETDSPEVLSMILDAIDHDSRMDGHETLDVAFEHGQHWVQCGACGASWSVVDCAGPAPFDFEKIDWGDDSCYDRPELEGEVSS